MSSSIIHATVTHQRCSPVVHSFSYPTIYCCFDLEQLERATVGWFSRNSLNLFSLHDKDFLPGKTGTLREKVLSVLEEYGLAEEIARIELITAPRVLLPVFNPVSFYRCYDRQGELRNVVCEVNNTFHETHLYVLHESLPQKRSNLLAFEEGKEFHVSPFNDMKGAYRFFFSRAEDGVDIRINIIKDGVAVFTTRLFGKSIPFTSQNILRTVSRMPLAAHLTVPRIVWEAAKLRFSKGLRVYTKPIASSSMTIRQAGPSALQRFCAKLGMNFMSKFAVGCLHVRFPDGTESVFGDENASLRGSMLIKNYDFFVRSVFFGDIGFAESYIDEQWEADDLSTVLRIFVENQETSNDRNLLTSYVGRLRNTVLHRLRKNSKLGSSKNIRAHYDLSNDLFQTFLDPTMTYSCAYYKQPDDSLEVAQRQKIAALIDKARLTASDHVLEIGCGWGALAIQAVETTGCRFTCITLSEDQLQLATARVKEAGLEDRITIKLCDYRDVQGTFDKIISVEMLEAVGHEYYSTFFDACERLVKPDGLVVLQVITIPEQRYEAYRNGCDFIQKYIFPGGLCPSLEALTGAISRSSNFIVDDLENIGAHYARTLREWRETFFANVSRVLSLGFDERFLRTWGYYLSYCEAGFSTHSLGTLQLVLTRPNNLQLARCPGYPR